MYSRHAQQRMQQRGISSQAVEWLLDFGHADYHRGREIFFWSRKSLACAFCRCLTWMALAWITLA